MKKIATGFVSAAILLLSVSYGFAAGFKGEKAEEIIKYGQILQSNSDGKAFFFSIVRQSELYTCQQTTVLDYVETVCWDTKK